MPNSTASGRMLRLLGELHDKPTDEVDALLFACAMALGHRLDRSPREILDMAFRCAIESEHWAASRNFLAEHGVL